MSIHTDDRQYGNEEERAEWLQELKREYRMENDEEVEDERRKRKSLL